MLVDVPMSPSMMDPEFGRFRHVIPEDMSLDLIPEVVRFLLFSIL